jgi:hypothetical protein
MVHIEVGTQPVKSFLDPFVATRVGQLDDLMKKV